MMSDRQAKAPLRRERGEETRQRLLQAAIEVFGRQGPEAATRAIAAAAGANLAAIPYHFGSKQGLYLAAAEHIAGEIRSRVGPALEQAQASIARDPAALGRDEAQALLQRILETFARMLVDEASASWARFVIREQMEPSAAFERLYAGFIHPTFTMLALLVGRITGRAADDPLVRLQVPRLIGQVMIFRAARATVLRELRWDAIGEAEFAQIRRVIRAAIEALDAAVQTEQGT